MTPSRAAGRGDTARARARVVGRHDVTAAAFDTTAALIIALDRSGRIMRFNAACERLTGLQEADVLGELLWPLVLDEAESARAQAGYAQISPDRAPGRYENTWLDQHGERRFIAWSTAFLLDDGGQIELVVSTGLDITREREIRLEREESEARFRALFEQSADGVVLADPHDREVPWRVVDCNAAFAHMNGYQREELIGQSLDVLHEDDLLARRGDEFLARIRQVGAPARSGGMHRRRDGSVFPIETASSVLSLGGRELVLGVDRDVSERHRTEAQLIAMNARLTHEAHHDTLTGLPNRTLLLDRLELERARADRSGRAFAVMFIDLDDFKRVNDSLGHDAGDDLLREASRRLQATLRPTDTVARLGGDEFVVLVPDVLSAHHAARVAHRLRVALGAPVARGGVELTVQSSVGISLSPQDGVLAADLMRHADMAMYAMKRSGKNGVQFYDPAMNAEAQARLRLETRLRLAISEETLGIHYQPQVDVATGALVGLEALVRWTDTDLGVVSPAEFIPVAEDTGMIVALGSWVLDEACRQAAEWQLDVPMAVNVSPHQLIRADFVDVVRAALRRHALAPHLLKLEITERLSLGDPGRAAQHLAGIERLGVRLSLDDFGSGQSALASLMALPLHEVKLDRTLLVGVTADPQSWQVVAALLALARGLNLPVVVEGVETAAQLDALRTMGCGSVQGYFTGRPQRPSELRGIVGHAAS
ncbi:putative bifunctional diguanylate cyclase/phosphodiesterase [Deinococcus sp. AB2017081]|uniref:putative bifunctional diguanylate cyclase/phosphodiesterase n=1 Tax=Deinococcus sp. AB2017081 TaxID=3093660 RepID=UPI002ACC1AD6|nr:EAL domain-containing protein [Deinococcus sp. AB2017081]WQE97402.1 EAL domain-containing protein [Deinococcus sp. AB2017081]